MLCQTLGKSPCRALDLTLVHGEVITSCSLSLFICKMGAHPASHVAAQERPLSTDGGHRKELSGMRRAR